jgi:ketosteroid isomerase-like protein
MSDKGKYVMVLRKDGAAWKISHDIFNSDLLSPPPPK